MNNQELSEIEIPGKKGEMNGNHILTEREVSEIKLYLRSYRFGLVTALAKKYSVRPGTIQNIRSGKNWKHTPTLEEISK